MHIISVALAVAANFLFWRESEVYLHVSSSRKIWSIFMSYHPEKLGLFMRVEDLIISDFRLLLQMQACGMYLPWNLEARTFEMQSHAMSIRSTSSPFAFGCQFGNLEQFRKKRPALEFEELGTGSEQIRTANSSTIERPAPTDLKVSLSLFAETTQMHIGIVI